MSKLTSIALVAIGAVLTFAGIDATTSFMAAVSRFFTSWPIDQAIWMVIFGLVTMACGLGGAWRARDRFD